MDAVLPVCVVVVFYSQDLVGSPTLFFFFKGDKNSRTQARSSGFKQVCKRLTLLLGFSDH